MTQARPSGGSSKQQPAEKINAKSRLFANENLPAPARTRGSSLPSLSPHPPFPLQSNHVALHLLRPSFQDSPHHRQKDRRRDERAKGRRKGTLQGAARCREPRGEAGPPIDRFRFHIAPRTPRWDFDAGFLPLSLSPVWFFLLYPSWGFQLPPELFVVIEASLLPSFRLFNLAVQPPAVSCVPPIPEQLAIFAGDCCCCRPTYSVLDSNFFSGPGDSAVQLAH